MSTFTFIERKVRVQVKDVVNYYGRSKEEKARMRRVANSIIQRCRFAYQLLRSVEKRNVNEDQ